MLVQFVVFVDRVVETLERSGCTGCALLMTLVTFSGGGCGGLVMPAGVYVVKGDQVRRVPAVDVTVVVGSNLAGS